MQQIDYQINNKFRIYIHKTPLRSLLNAKAFESKCSVLNKLTQFI